MNFRQSSLFSPLGIQQQWAETTNALFARQVLPALGMSPAICDPVTLVLHPLHPRINDPNPPQTPATGRTNASSVEINLLEGLSFGFLDCPWSSHLGPRDLLRPHSGARGTPVFYVVPNSINQSSGFVY